MVSSRKEMRYLRSLVANSSECRGAFVSTAQTPTVTMPRIKALVTGTVPNFIDVMNNIDSAALQEDNVVERLRSHSQRLVFYGDETWLKLFPTHFQRSDGTSSFFTKDFTIVDQNVSRHIEEEFDPLFKHQRSNDWDAVFLHYLGLDHIGHQHGPDSRHMGDKLREMDIAFELVHTGLKQQEIARKRRNPDALPTLLLLLSDHGMTNQGNHGGASKDETSAFLVLQHVDASQASPHKAPGSLKLGKVMQVDLAPTLGLLLGVGIPEQSVGSIIPEAFPQEVKAKAYEANAKQLHANVVANGAVLSEEGRIVFANEEYEQFIHIGKEALIGVRPADGASIREAIVLVSALVLMAIPTAGALYWAGGFQTSSDIVCLGMAMVVHPFGFFSSSFIENEHAFWYHVFTLWLLLRALLCFARNQPFSASKLLAVAGLMRTMRSRLQIINWALLNGEADPTRTNDGTAVLVVPQFMAHRMTAAVSVVIITVACIGLLREQSKSLTRCRVAIGVSLIACCSICFIKTDSVGQAEVLVARVVFVCVFAQTVLALLCSSTSEAYPFVFTAMFVLIALVHRREQTVIISLIAAATLIITDHLQQSVLGWKESAVVLCCLGQCAFFGLGNSHAIATMDISGAYTGLSEYIFAVVFFLTGVILFSSHLLPMALFFSARMKGLKEADLVQSMWGIAAWSCYRMCIASTVLVLMRNHLFIWTVFAPKWVYEFLSTLMVFVVTHVMCS